MKNETTLNRAAPGVIKSNPASPNVASGDRVTASDLATGPRSVPYGGLTTFRTTRLMLVA